MKRDYGKRCLIAFLGLILSGCLATGYSPEAHKKAKEVFDRPSKQITYSENASYRFLSIAKKIDTFPDNEQSVDQFCREGLPSKYSHFQNWFKKHKGALLQTVEVLKNQKYVLDSTAITDPSRPDMLNGLGRLLLLNTVLLEKEGRIDQAYVALLNVYRFINLILQDAMADDYYLAWNFQRKANAVMTRYLEKLTNQELNQTIIFLERSNRNMKALQAYLDRKKQSAALTIQQYLAPSEEDGFFESTFGMSASALEQGVEEIQSAQIELLKKPSAELFKNEIWNSVIDMIHSKSNKDIFFTYFFGWQQRNNVISLQRIHYFMSVIQTNNELRQLQAQWVLEKRAAPQSTPTLEELKKNLKKLHKGLKENPLKESFIDRFSGKPYGYRKEKYFSLIWSIGPDLKNTDGLFPLDMEKGQGDIVLKLH